MPDESRRVFGTEKSTEKLASRGKQDLPVLQEILVVVDKNLRSDEVVDLRSERKEKKRACVLTRSLRRARSR